MASSSCASGAVSQCARCTCQISDATQICIKKALIDRIQQLEKETQDLQAQVEELKAFKLKKTRPGKSQREEKKQKYLAAALLVQRAWRRHCVAKVPKNYDAPREGGTGMARLPVPTMTNCTLTDEQLAQVLEILTFRIQAKRMRFDTVQEQELHFFLDEAVHLLSLQSDVQSMPM